MTSGAPSEKQVFDHLCCLDQQEKDARIKLSMPEEKPGVHAKLRQLIVRISHDRAKLEAALGKRYGTQVGHA